MSLFPPGKPPSPRSVAWPMAPRVCAGSRALPLESRLAVPRAHDAHSATRASASPGARPELPPHGVTSLRFSSTRTWESVFRVPQTRGRQHLRAAVGRGPEAGVHDDRVQLVAGPRVLVQKNVTRFLFFMTIYTSAFGDQKCVKNRENGNENTGKQVFWLPVSKGEE